MIGLLKGIRKIILLLLISPFILITILLSILQYIGGVEPEETFVGKFNKIIRNDGDL